MELARTSRLLGLDQFTPARPCSFEPGLDSSHKSRARQICSVFSVQVITVEI